MPPNDKNMDTKQQSMYSPIDLLEAAKAGNSGLLVQCLTTGIDPNTTDTKEHFNYTALHYTAKYNHTEALTTLLSNKGVDVGSRTLTGSTALIEAAGSGSAKAVNLILSTSLEGNKTIDYTNAFGTTALMAAAGTGQLEVCRILLGNDSDPALKDTNGNIALHCAAFNGNFEICALLAASPRSLALSEEKDKNNDGFTALMYAGLGGHPQCIEILVDSGAPIDSRNNEGETTLMLAVRKRQWDVVRALSRLRANMHIADNNGRSPIDIIRGHPQDEQNFITSWFYSTLNIQNEPQDTILAHYFDGAYIGSLSHIQYYSEKGKIPVDAVDSSGVSATMIASHNGHTALLHYLVDHGSDVNLKSNFDDTALIFACESSNFEAVRYLLDKGASILPQNKNNENAAWHAAKLHNTDCLRALYRNAPRDWFELLQQHVPDKNNTLIPLREFLVESGIQDPDLLKNTGARKLIAAASAGNIDRLREYLTSDIASVDACMDNGDTALIVASSLGNDEVVRFLIEHDARIDLSNSADNTPLLMAAKNGKDRCLGLLIDAKASINHLNKEKHNALMEAISCGSFPCVKLLLSVPDISKNHNDSRGETSVHYACKYNSPVILKALIEAKFDLEKCDSFMSSPLDFAARFSAAGNKSESDLVSIVQCAKLLLENVSNPEEYVNKSNRNGWTALHRWAHSNGSAEFLNLLRKYNASLEAVTINGDTPLLIAAQSPHFRCFHLLLLAGADRFHVNENGKTIDDYIVHKPTFVRALKEGKDFRFSEFLDAAKTNDVEAIQRLVNENVNVDASEAKTKMTGLMLAAASGSVEALKFLISNGATINVFNIDHDTPMILAAENGHVECLKVLLSQNSVVINERNHMGNTALHRSILHLAPDCCKLLLENNADVTICNKAGYSPLLYAARKGRLEHLKLLLQYFRKSSDQVVHINDAQKVGYDEVDANNAFLEAVKIGQVEATELLLEAGARIDYVDSKAHNAAMVASHNNHPQMLQMLIRKGIGVNKKDDSGNTALILAAKAGHSTIISILIGAGASGKLCDNRGNTALMFAAIFNHLNCLEIMMRKEGFVELHAANDEHFTAIMLAAQHESSDCITALARWGADGHQARQLHANPTEFDRLFEAGTNHETILLEHLVELKQLRANAIVAKKFVSSFVHFATNEADNVTQLDNENDKKLHLPLRKKDCDSESELIKQQLKSIVDDYQYRKELLSTDEQLADRISGLKDHIDTYYHHAAEGEVLISSVLKNSILLMNNAYQRVKQTILDRLHHYNPDLQERCLKYAEQSSTDIDPTDLRWTEALSKLYNAIHQASIAPILHYDDEKSNEDLQRKLLEWRKRHQETRFAHDHVYWDDLLEMKLKISLRDYFTDQTRETGLSPNDPASVLVDENDPLLETMQNINVYDSSANSFSIIRFSQAKQRERDALEALRQEVEKQMKLLKSRIESDFISPLVSALFNFYRSRFVSDSDLVKEWRRFSALSTSLSSQSSLAQVLIMHLRSKKKNATFSIDELLDQSSLDLISLLSQFLKSTANKVGVQAAAAPSLVEQAVQQKIPNSSPHPQKHDDFLAQGLKALAEGVSPESKNQLPPPYQPLPSQSSQPQADSKPDSNVPPPPLSEPAVESGLQSLQDVINLLINKPPPDPMTADQMRKHEAKIRNLFKSIFSDLLKIHAEGSVHGLLQPSHILIVKVPNSNPPKQQLKLSNFRVVENKIVMKDRLMTVIRNISHYTAPEIANAPADTVMNTIPTSYSDVYSAARMMYQIINFGQLPPAAPELSLSDFVSPPLRHLLAGCLLPPSLKRLTSAQCYNHEFFGGPQNENQLNKKQDQPNLNASSKSEDKISPMDVESKKSKKDLDHKANQCCVVM